MAFGEWGEDKPTGLLDIDGVTHEIPEEVLQKLLSEGKLEKREKEYIFVSNASFSATEVALLLKGTF